MFYLFFPLTRRVRGKLLLAVLCVFIVLGPWARTVFSAGNDVWHEYSYLGGMDAIAFGCLTAILLDGQKLGRQTLRWSAAAGVALLIFSLGFSKLAAAWGLEATGLDMTVVAIGACLIITAAAHSHWAAPWFLQPLTRLGQRSYEIYLTHMFVVFALFELSRSRVVLLFAATVLLSALLGEAVARLYSEPMNRRLRGQKPTLTPDPNGLY
jgi:peptidoglycan/LPS O-acetylase OafA/YrhL